MSKVRPYRTSTSPWPETIKDPSDCFNDMYHLYSLSLRDALGGCCVDVTVERTCLSGPTHLQDQGDQQSRESTLPHTSAVSVQPVLAHHRTPHLGAATA